jgi:hypothetical protein
MLPVRTIGLQEDANGDAALYFGPVQLGTIDGGTLKFAPRAPRPLSSRARNPKASCPQAHSRWDCAKHPGCGLVDNSPEQKAKCEKVLPMLPD